MVFGSQPKPKRRLTSRWPGQLLPQLQVIGAQILSLPRSLILGIFQERTERLALRPTAIKLQGTHAYFTKETYHVTLALTWHTSSVLSFYMHFRTETLFKEETR